MHTWRGLVIHTYSLRRRLAGLPRRDWNEMTMHGLEFVSLAAPEG
jgi:hypothetical protein